MHLFSGRRKQFIKIFHPRRDLPSKVIEMPKPGSKLSEEHERLVEAGRQDNTTVANVSVTIYTTIQYRYFK
jgi:hypothetical protein